MGVAARIVVKIIGKTPVTTAGGSGTALAWTSRTPACAARVADLLRDPGGTRRVIVLVLAQIPLAETADVAVTGVEKRKNQDRSAGSASPSRLPAPEQPPAPSLPGPQHIVLPTVHRPAPSEPASEKPSTLLSEISFRPNQREGVNRKCYASLDTKSLMKLPTIPFDTADGNSQMNLVNFTSFRIPGWHKPLMRHVLNSVSHHYLAQVTRTKQMLRDAFARAEADERSGKPERQVLERILRALCLGLNPSSPNQALQQPQTFEVPEKISFADFLSELRIAVINVKSLALVPPNDSTVQVVVKASIDDQFATLAASILAGRTRSAIPSSIIEDLLDSLGDLTLTRTPAIVATRFSKDSRGRD